MVWKIYMLRTVLLLTGFLYFFFWNVPMHWSVVVCMQNGNEIVKLDNTFRSAWTWLCCWPNNISEFISSWPDLHLIIHLIFMKQPSLIQTLHGLKDRHWDLWLERTCRWYIYHDNLFTFLKKLIYLCSLETWKCQTRGLSLRFQVAGYSCKLCN